jgi:hypothetical protein
VSKIGDRRVVSHGGGFPGFITYTAIDPVDGLVVTALTNAIDGPAEVIVNAVVRLVNRAEAAGRPDPDTAGVLDRVTGRWFGLWGATDVVRLGADLLAIDPELLDPIPDASRLEPIDGEADAFRIAATGGYASFGETVRFEPESGALQFAGARLLPLPSYLEELERRTSSSGTANAVASPPST